MSDITIRVNDTLELDAIINMWDPKSQNVITVENGTDYTLNGFQTSTGVFNPQSSGDYTLNVNGQKIEIEVLGSEGKIVDDFEDGSLSEYEFNASSSTVQQSVVKEGTNALKLSESGSNPGGIASTSGLNTYVSQDETTECWIRCNNRDAYFVRSSNGNSSLKSGMPQGYHIGKAGSYLEINIYNSSNRSTLKTSSNGNVSTGTWYKLVTSYSSSNDEITAELFDTNGNTVEGPISATDSTFSDQTGIGFAVNSGGNVTGYFDYLTKF